MRALEREVVDAVYAAIEPLLRRPLRNPNRTEAESGRQPRRAVRQADLRRLGYLVRIDSQ